MKLNNQTKEGWEERFYKKFSPGYMEWATPSNLRKELFDFMTKELQQAEQRVARDITKIARDLKFNEETANAVQRGFEDENRGYNQAMKDLLLKLKHQYNIN